MTDPLETLAGRTSTLHLYGRGVVEERSGANTSQRTFLPLDQISSVVVRSKTSPWLLAGAGYFALQAIGGFILSLTGDVPGELNPLWIGTGVAAVAFLAGYLFYRPRELVVATDSAEGAADLAVGSDEDVRAFSEAVERAVESRMRGTTVSASAKSHAGNRPPANRL